MREANLKCHRNKDETGCKDVNCKGMCEASYKPN